MVEDNGNTSSSSSTLSVVPNKAGLLAATNLPSNGVGSAPSAGSPTATTTSSTPDTESLPYQRRQRQHQQQQNEEALDFIGTGPAVKTLFSIPIAEQSVCVAVHNIDGTLLIDEVVPEDNDDGSDRTASQPQFSSRNQHTDSLLPPSSQSLALALSPDGDDQSQALELLSQMIEKIKELPAEEGKDYDQELRSIVVPPQSPPAVREYVEWQFHDMNLLIGSDAMIVRPEVADTSSGVLIRVEEVQKLRWLVDFQQQQEEQQQSLGDGKEADTPSTARRSYADALLKPPVNQSLLTTDESDYEKSSETGSKDDDPANPLNLDRVQLQTCIVPSSGPLGGWLKSKPVPTSMPSDVATGATAHVSHADTGMPSPKCMVLDAYLDSLMTNVPQLALCLQEKGLIQSVKLLARDQIPAMMMHPSTLDTTKPVETIQSTSSDTSPDLFSPEIMEMNATALLRFLKANCTSNNTTYLLRTDASATDGNNIQLYDISSISQQRQKKWIWWLATMSYRFALRLRQLESHDVLPMRQRTFRDRQRNLLQSTLDLLQDLRDMDGKAHESLVASVREHMADTFLGQTSSSSSSETSEESPDTGGSASTSASKSNASPTPVTASSSPNLSVTAASSTIPASPVKMNGSGTHKESSATSKQNTAQASKPQHQPYSSITTDALNKAQDHLIMGIKVLSPTLESQMRYSSAKNATGPRRRRRGESASASFESTEPAPLSAMVSQLFGLNYKVVNVTLRLAEHYLGQYSSSSAMQSLRHAARRMVDSIALLDQLPNPNEWIPRLRLQYTWLWEHCGHFARSFASDELWRERGHASGDDILYVLRDVETAFGRESLPYNFSNLPDPLRSKTKGLVSLQSLSALYAPHIGELKKFGKPEPAFWDDARSMVANQGLLQREKREVLIASCISYNRAIMAFQELPQFTEDVSDESSALLNLLRQRLGDACNETGKVLLASLRAFLARKGAEASLGLADVLLDSAQFWFLEGLDAFEASADSRNIALLRCNLCQCCKLRANNSFSSQATNELSHAEVCLEKAASHLQAAHEKLDTRDNDPTTWDMVSNELAATYLVLAVRRRQSLLGGGATPVVFEAMRLSPGKERSIVEPMEKALSIYQQSGNYHQAAAVQYQLALTNSKMWTCQRDEGKTREKLSAAFTQYQNAFAYFSSHLGGNEPTFVLLCLDIASLYAAVSGEECLVQALKKCLDTVEAFGLESSQRNPSQSPEWLEKMETLASSVDDRVFKLLRGLVKINGDRWKDLYREGLTAKMSQADTVDETIAASPASSRALWRFHQRLVSLREKFHDVQTTSTNSNEQ